MKKMLDKLYHKWLWFAGEPLCPEDVLPGGEHYSNKLWRQKERLGKWWYAGLFAVCSVVLLLNACFVWLVLHIFKKV